MMYHLLGRWEGCEGIITEKGRMSKVKIVGAGRESKT